MAGQMGNKKVTIQSLEVVSIDEERSLILVKGGVPGSIGGWVEITDAKKKSLPANVPYPAGIKGSSKNSQKETMDAKQINNDEKKEETAVAENKNLKQDTNEITQGKGKETK